MIRNCILISFTAMIFISGCSGIQNKFQQRNLFRIQAGAVKPEVMPCKKKAGLLIRQFSISPAFDTRFFVYRISQNRYIFDYYNEFMASPAAMITEAMEETLYASSCFKPAEVNTPQDIQYQLWGKIIDIHGDIQDKNHPEAVMTMRVILEKRKGTGFIQIINKIYPASVNLTTGYYYKFNAKNLISAWDLCLEHILSDFNKDLLTRHESVY